MHISWKKRVRYRLQTSFLCLLVFTLMFPVQTVFANVPRAETEPEQESHVVVWKRISQRRHRALSANAAAKPHRRHCALPNDGHWQRWAISQRDRGQLADAKEILLAQVTHNAGARRWSDYVSDMSTYRYEQLTSDEYEWIDITNGKNNGKPGDNVQGDAIGRGSEGSVNVALQSPNTIHGSAR